MTLKIKLRKLYFPFNCVLKIMTAFISMCFFVGSGPSHVIKVRLFDKKGKIFLPSCRVELLRKFKRSTHKLRFRSTHFACVIYVDIYNFSYVDLISWNFFVDFKHISQFKLTNVNINLKRNPQFCHKLARQICLSTLWNSTLSRPPLTLTTIRVVSMSATIKVVNTDIFMWIKGEWDRGDQRGKMWNNFLLILNWISLEKIV